MAKTLRNLYDELRLKHGASGGEQMVAKLAQMLVGYAVDAKASDVHVEPGAAGARIRYRIDGVLHELLDLPRDVSDSLVRSLKVQANMSTDAVGRSKPQDARIALDIDGRAVDLCLSSFPTVLGDTLAVRVLDRSAARLSLEQLGVPADLSQEFQRLIERPNGVILVTGPSGSGKTTTLYASLDTLHSPSVKIVTIEDPVEYQLEGIDQAQVNAQIGFTFSSGLSAMLRQDPDIILVGDLSDRQTADIGIRAALTGHLVFSSLHTRHSCGAVTRLLDMGIEPHLITASVSAIVAQRLVRTLCSECAMPDSNAAAAFERIWTKATSAPVPDLSGAAFQRVAGCPACQGTGYQGRTGIFELLAFTDPLKHAVLDGGGQLYNTALANGLRTMLVDGLEKAGEGITTIEEVLRVTEAAETA